jgi:tryptophanyl-tRNA synthetase
MSKSYDNTIPLFVPPEELKRRIAGIVTDSRAPGEPKDVEGSALFQIYQAFASAEETAALRQAYADGIGWGDAKQKLFERIDREVAPMRDTYQGFLADPARLEDILQAGAAKARRIATPLMAELRQAVGLRRLVAAGGPQKAAKAAKAALPVFKQYREADGLFHFKLQDAQGAVLLQSKGYTAPRDAGQAIAALQQPGADLPALVTASADAAAGPVLLGPITQALAVLATARDA